MIIKKKKTKNYGDRKVSTARVLSADGMKLESCLLKSRIVTEYVDNWRLMWDRAVPVAHKRSSSHACSFTRGQ